MSYEQVSYRVTGRIARLRMERPQYRNAQSQQLLRELDAGFAAAMADPAVRVVVLAGAGDAFSSGHDLGTPERLVERGLRRTDVTEVEDRFDYSYEHFLDMSLRWRDLPKPTIAEVHGWCIFGGWMIASAMDLIVAADDARFMTSFLQYFPLPNDVGARKAKELLFDAHEISASEAQELGFLNRVVPRDRLEEETTALAERIAKNDAFWLRMAKMSVNLAQDAAGFKAAVTGAHAHYMISQLERQERARAKAALEGLAEPPPMRRMPMVERILREGGGV